MKAWVIGLIVVGAVGAAGAGWVATGGSLFPKSEDEIFQEACIAALKERLRSPSTFVLDEWTPNFRRPATWEEYEPERPTRAKYGSQYEDMLENYERSLEWDRATFERGVVVSTAGWIEYEAQNAFGTPIANIAECKYVGPAGGDWSGPTDRNVKINGETHFEWVMSSLREGS